MKTFIILLIICLLGITLAIPFEYELHAAEKYCLKQVQLTRAELIQQQVIDKPTENLKGFSTCLLEKIEFLKDGILQEDIMLRKSKSFQYPAFFKNCLRLCKNIKGIDRYDTGYKISSCFEKVDREYFENEWLTIANDCRKEENLSEEEYMTIQYFPVDNPTLAMKRYAICMFEKQGLLRGNILQENVILNISKDYKDTEYLKTFVSTCKEIHDNNRYDNAFKLFECMKKVKDTNREL